MSLHFCHKTKPGESQPLKFFATAMSTVLDVECVTFHSERNYPPLCPSSPTAETPKTAKEVMLDCTRAAQESLPTKEIFMVDLQSENEECYFIDPKSIREEVAALDRLVFAILSNVLQQMPLRLYTPIAYTPLMPHPDDTFRVYHWFLHMALYSEDPSNIVLTDRADSCLLLGFTLNQIDAKELVGSGVQHFYGRLRMHENIGVIDVCIMRTDRTEAVLYEEYYWRPKNIDVYNVLKQVISYS
jgi:hypothetical protein